MLDTERGARTSGSRFVYLMGDLVFVQFALMRHAMDILNEKGFLPVIPPVLVREEAMYGTGFLPTDEAQLYVTREDDLYLVGTAEVPLAALHLGEILDEDELPAAVRGLLDVLPARGRHLRQGHGRDVPRAPVRQGRDVHASPRPRRAGTSTSTS